ARATRPGARSARADAETRGVPPAARPSLAREHPGAQECLGTGTAAVSGRRAERGRAPAVGASGSSRWTDSFPRTAAPDHDRRGPREDRKSTRLNSSHVAISYAVFCLKKKTD